MRAGESHTPARTHVFYVLVSCAPYIPYVPYAAVPNSPTPRSRWR